MINDIKDIMIDDKYIDVDVEDWWFHFSDESLRTYNKIFSFLVGVKRALWCLQATSLKQIAQIDQQLQVGFISEMKKAPYLYWFQRSFGQATLS